MLVGTCSSCDAPILLDGPMAAPRFTCTCRYKWQGDDEPIRRPQWEVDLTELRIAMQNVVKALDELKRLTPPWFPYYVPAPAPPSYPYPSYPIITCGAHTNTGSENVCSSSQAYEHGT